MRIKCIALDLDRTTLNSAGALSGKNREALREAAESGICVAVASGRPLSALPEDVLAVPGIRYAITSNGAAVYDLEEDRCLHRHRMTPESVRGILACTAGEPVVLEAFIEGSAFAEQVYVEDPVAHGALPGGAAYIRRTRRPVRGMRRFLEEHRGELDSVDIVVRDEREKERLWRILEERIEEIYITSSVRQLLEISHADAGKDAAARFLLGRLGLREEELAAFGDGHNDSGLLRLAGIGFAVANASAECLEAADRVVASNDDDGVAEGIGSILRLNRATEREERIGTT